ncbi:sister chromatid separation protein-like protein [Aaosphaeria arxii CBS 175.79]|uniref:Sister chromatid separation protein-like protein n=1 Tax=Aaosphaeria arxii CBS 175.79 TaxID=1450172 RepID=A0A6A5XG02_9PLEO|nr:sister chromatid separation protein-like protein [Aaosphaeria arxii CBS 175.79]KAF2011860.1 sister chromatid separation protein-like protein [Aaosphaeria arxii CBS 175.79]
MADARGEYWYFDPEVDPSKITVPELRSILLKHGVTYPSSAKKAILLDHFREQVLPQADKIQRAQARTKRSTRGIVDVPSSQESTTTEDPEDDTLLAPPPPSTVRRTSRRTRAATEEEHDLPTTRSKTPSRTVPTKHARTSDLEPEDQPAVRRNRKSVTPAVKQDSPDPESWHNHDIESPFTQDNPFQSGSSPVAPDTVSRDRRRKTIGFEHKEKRKSDTHRRRTVQPSAEQLDDGIIVPTRRTFDVPIKQEYKEEELPEPDDNDLGEEFTPEEQLSLVRERAKNGEKDILPPRRRKQPSKASGTLKAFSLTLLSTTAAVLGGLWRQEKYAVGFCGIGRESTYLANLDIPEWASPALPQCEPCPPHAICYQNLELLCDKDFVKKEHPLSFGGLIPLPPTCEPDSEKTRRVTLVADRAVHALRERKAQFECGEPDKEGKPVQSPEVSETELKEKLSSVKRKGMSDDEFENLFRDAIGEVVRREEVAEHTNGTTGDRRLASNSLAELPLGCSIKRSLRQAVERHLWQLALIVLLLGSGSYGRYSFTANRAMEVRAKQLASDVFDRLANHAAFNHQDPSAYPELGISMTQLRDDILRAEFSAARRQKMWQKVQKKVEHNSNVRAAVKETQTGDVARMWEWVGPVQMIEDGRGAGNKRQSGRYSFGPAIPSSPPDSAARQVKQELKTWDEGRPIY